MKWLSVLTLVFILGACTSGRTGEALQAIGTWDIANYGACAHVDIEVDKAEFTIPNLNVPMYVEGLDATIVVKIGKYGDCGMISFEPVEE
jgi:hypothetical protein